MAVKPKYDFEEVSGVAELAMGYLRELRDTGSLIPQRNSLVLRIKADLGLELGLALAGVSQMETNNRQELSGMGYRFATEQPRFS